SAGADESGRTVSATASVALVPENPPPPADVLIQLQGAPAIPAAAGDRSAKSTDKAAAATAGGNQTRDAAPSVSTAAINAPGPPLPSGSAVPVAPHLNDAKPTDDRGTVQGAGGDSAGAPSTGTENSAYMLFAAPPASLQTLAANYGAAPQNGGTGINPAQLV